MYLHCNVFYCVIFCIHVIIDTSTVKSKLVHQIAGYLLL